MSAVAEPRLMAAELNGAAGAAGSTLGDWPLLAGPGVIWGASFLFIAEGLRSVGPNGLTFARILVGFATLALVPAARRSVPRREWLGLGALGVLWLALPLTLFPYAELRVSSALTGMLNGANPLFVAVVAALLTRRAPSRGVAAGLAVGLAGTVLIAVPSFGEGTSSALGVLLIVIALACYGLALNLALPLQQRHGGLPVIWRAQAVALILTAPLGVPELLAARWQPGPLLAVLALGVLGTAVAHVLMANAAGRFGPTRASATTFLIPGVALVLGVLVRDEKVAALAVLGGVVCVAGAWMIRRAKAGAARPTRRRHGSPEVKRTAAHAGLR
jgi:drug/metabolite transporter (DMT)-like permease